MTAPLALVALLPRFALERPVIAMLHSSITGIGFALSERQCTPGRSPRSSNCCRDWTIGASAAKVFDAIERVDPLALMRHRIGRRSRWLATLLSGMG